MFKIKTTTKFEKDVILCFRRNYEIDSLNQVLVLLELQGTVPSKFKPHKLKGSLKGYWECHIKPDWLLIWSVDFKLKEIVLVRCGTHADLFG